MNQNKANTHRTQAYACLRRTCASIATVAALSMGLHAHGQVQNSSQSEVRRGANTTSDNQQRSASQDQDIVRELLDAIAQNDFERFINNGTSTFKQLEEAQFRQVAAAVGPRLRQGYSVEYFGLLRQQGLEITVWKISPNDAGDDLLTTLNVVDGRIGGFFLR